MTARGKPLDFQAMLGGRRPFLSQPAFFILLYSDEITPAGKLGTPQSRRQDGQTEKPPRRAT